MTKINSTKNHSIARSLVTVAIASFIAAPAMAGEYRNSTNYDNATYEYARVVDVQPRVETYQVNNPVESCWNERVPVRERSTAHYRNSRKSSKTPEILGAILGGVVGNQVGKRGGGKARDVATVAGAVLGGSIGRDVKHRNRGQYDSYEVVGYENVKRCEVKDSYETREQVVGYDVAYKYRGSVFHTQMNQRPGDKIKVRVTVDPV